MLLLYNIGIQIYSMILRLFSLFNAKAKLFVEGRKGLLDKISSTIDSNHAHVWFHFASLGEFEQGRTVLEKIKTAYPDKRIVITFFSPSGYEIRKNYPLADGVFYLPLDTARNAKRFIDAVNPEVAIFTKYEYWHHYFNVLYKRNVPLFIISGIFRSNQIYFKFYGGFYRSILKKVAHFFVQNEVSKTLLADIGLINTTVSGDTRFDRVFSNAENPKAIRQIEDFCQDKPTMIAGSTWPADEKLLVKLIDKMSEWKFIIAPHEIHNSRIEDLSSQLQGSVKYSQLGYASSDAQVLIIDNIGLLSSIYQYGRVAYIGGGFGVGIHNTLEAAAFGLPVIFGPNYHKFEEAKDLLKIGAARSISNEEELFSAFHDLTRNTTPAETARNYVSSKKGSTDVILERIASVLVN